jgi:ABC-type polysaccharide/polyol phosphate export permease
MSAGTAASGTDPGPWRPPILSREFHGSLDEPLLKRLSPVRLWQMLRDDARELSFGRYVIEQFVTSVLRVRYQNSMLGLLWTLLHPLLMLTVLSVVFSRLLKYPMDRFSVFLFAGLLPWQFFQASVGNASVSLIRQQGLIRKINVNLMLFPVSEIATAATHMLFAFVAMFVIMLGFGMFGTEHVGAQLSVHLVLVPLGLVLLWVFTLGASLALMTLTTFFRDMEHIISVALQAMYFATPIFYPVEAVAGSRSLTLLMYANPLRWIFEFFHCGIYYHRWPATEAWIVAPCAAVGMLLLGYSIYKRHEHEFIFRL